MRDLDEAEAQSIAAGIALKRVYQRHKINHAISFHRSIRSADRFREQQDALNRLRRVGPKTTNLHISSKKTAGQRSDLLRQFVYHKRALMTNARCLTEGVDVPAIDCVMFADPKQSRVDIVQAAGRALREHQGKRFGYIIVPLIVPEKMDFETFAETTEFRQVVKTITALSTQDERIADEFRAIEKGRISSGKIVEIEGDVPVGMKVALREFAEAVSTRVWESVGRTNWLEFEPARAFVRSLGLKSETEWRAYRRSDRKPFDIPTNPHRVYADVGWAGMGDWLGTERVAAQLRVYRPFKKARAFVRSLGLRLSTEWHRYCKSGKRPGDIPSHPHVVYAKAGWMGYGDWLGTGKVARGQHRPFKKAREFVQALKLKSGTEWMKYCKSSKKPTDIPTNPQRTYAQAGWAGMGDWLGTGRVADRLHMYLPFDQARTFARTLGLKSRSDWEGYCKSSKKPTDIPTNPQRTYAQAGWAGMGDWLGTGRVADRLHMYWSFEKARSFTRHLGLRSRAEWSNYCKSEKKPTDIPTKPQRTYAKVGWVGWGDWLGTGTIAPRLRQYRSFKTARAFSRRLGLKSHKEWVTFCKAGHKPSDVPTNPNVAYKEAGWSGYGDWLGTERVADQLRVYRPFKKARAFVRTLGLKSAPHQTYSEDGWAGIGDWLGTRRFSAQSLRPFKEARTFVHQLGLMSAADWRQYCSRGDRPADIPSHPHVVYAQAGWVSWGDWLGTGRATQHRYSQVIRLLPKAQPPRKKAGFVHNRGALQETLFA